MNQEGKKKWKDDRVCKKNKKSAGAVLKKA